MGQNLDIAGIAGAGLTGFLQGRESKQQADLQREEFDYRKEQDSKAEARAVELQNFARERHKIELPTAEADLAIKLLDLGEAKRDEEKAAAMEGILRSRGTSPALIEALGMLADLEGKQERVKSEKMSQAAAAANIRQSDAGTALTQLHTRMAEKEFANMDVDTRAKRMTQAASAGFIIDPNYGEEMFGFRKGSLTNAPVGGASVEPLKLQMEKVDKAITLAKENPTDKTLKENALIQLNMLSVLNARTMGVDPSTIEPVKDIDLSKPLTASDWISILNATSSSPMFGGAREVNPGQEDLNSKALGQLRSAAGMGGTDAGTITLGAAAAVPPYVSAWATTPERQKDLADFVKAQGRYPSEAELKAADASETPAQSAPASSIWSQIGSYFTSGAEKNQKK